MIGSLIPVSFPQAGKEGKAGEHHISPVRSQSHPPRSAHGSALLRVGLITGNYVRNKCRMLLFVSRLLVTIVLIAVPKKSSFAEAAEPRMSQNWE